MADAFHLAAVHIEHLLAERETLMADFLHAGAAGDAGLADDLGNEVGFDMHDDNRHLGPVDIRADIEDIFRLGRIVILEINGVVDVTEFVHIVEPDLHGDHMLECPLFHIARNKTGAKVV